MKVEAFKFKDVRGKEQNFVRISTTSTESIVGTKELIETHHEYIMNIGEKSLQEIANLCRIEGEEIQKELNKKTETKK